MPGASPSRRNSLPLIAVWTPGEDRGLWTAVFMQTAEEQSASLGAGSQPQTFAALLKAIPLFTG